MGVTADVHIDHPYHGDLRVAVADPSGWVETVLFDGQPDGSGALRLTAAPVNHTGDDAVNGPWTLRVVDGAAENEGTLVSWTLHVTSRWD